jgi:hypothetical protein
MTPLDLLGDWVLDRIVVDRAAGQRRFVQGTTTLRRVDDDTVAWTEAGTMTWSGGSVPVSRTLSIVRGADGGWTVLFADGREFHRWVDGETVVHDCAPDTYTGLVSGTPSRWHVLWEASGPVKDYRMESTLTPVPRTSPRS